MKEYTHKAIEAPIVLGEYGIESYDYNKHPRTDRYPHGKVTNFKEWLIKSMWVHGCGRYDYTDVDYIGAQYKVTIDCNKCGGSFHQRAGSHSNDRRGCVHCRSKNRTFSLDHLIDRVKEKHPQMINIIDFSGATYKNWNTPLKLSCTLCNANFTQHPSALNLGYGCPHCQSMRNYQRTTELALSDFHKIHGNLYSYERFKYKNATSKSTIICKIHGEFMQSYVAHKKGHGCPECAIRKKTITEIQKMSQHEKDLPYHLYHICVFDKLDGSVFDKIGVSIYFETRFKGREYERFIIIPINIIKGRKEDILIKEIDILDDMARQSAKWRLSRLKGKFSGWSECFLIDEFDPYPYFQ